MPSYCSVRTNPPWDDKKLYWLILFHFSYFSKPTYISDKSIIILQKSEFLFLLALLKFLSYASRIDTNSLLNRLMLC